MMINKKLSCENPPKKNRQKNQRSDAVQPSCKSKSL